MPLNSREKALIQDAEIAAEQSVRRDVSDSIEKMYRTYDNLERVPVEVTKAFLERALTTDEASRTAWEQRAENQNHWDVHAEATIGKGLSNAIARLHSDDVGEDDGIADDNIREAVHNIKGIAGLPAQFPSSLVEAVLFSEAKGSEEATEAWDLHTSQKGSHRWRDVERAVGHKLRNIANTLIERTRPEAMLPDNLTPPDLFAMSDREWELYKQRSYALQARKKRR